MSWLDEEIEINGTKNTVRMWLRISGLKYDTVRERYKKGKTGADLFASVDIRNIKIQIRNEVHTAKEWAKISGLDEEVIKARYYKGKRGIDLIAPTQKNKIWGKWYYRGITAKAKTRQSAGKIIIETW